MQRDGMRNVCSGWESLTVHVEAGDGGKPDTTETCVLSHGLGARDEPIGLARLGV